MELQLKSLQECSPKELLDLEARSFTSDQISPRSFRRLLKRPTAAGQGIFSGQKLIGYSLILFRSNSTRARIYSLAVDLDQRGRGIGKLLLEGALRLAQAKGSTSIQLEVAAGNESAIRLYQSMDFKLAGRRARYYEDGADALVFVRMLGPAG